jgi:chorismate mutase
MVTVMRGIRGATTVEQNSEEQILLATSELLQALSDRNGLKADEIASIFITVTTDLDATFPARAIRYIQGWDLVPLMCSQEMVVPSSLPKCIRLMIHVNTTKSQAEIQHVYLREAVRLRPDLVDLQ